MFRAGRRLAMALGVEQRCHFTVAWEDTGLVCIYDGYLAVDDPSVECIFTSLPPVRRTDQPEPILQGTDQFFGTVIYVVLHTHAGRVYPLLHAVAFTGVITGSGHLFSPSMAFFFPLAVLSPGSPVYLAGHDGFARFGARSVLPVFGNLIGQSLFYIDFLYDAATYSFGRGKF